MTTEKFSAAAEVMPSATRTEIAAELSGLTLRVHDDNSKTIDDQNDEESPKRACFNWWQFDGVKMAKGYNIVSAVC